MGSAGGIPIAPGVWWVGTQLPDDTFQCHAYFIHNGDASVLIDPGSPLTIQATLDKVAAIADLSSIKYLVCHHPDPDIAASLPHLSSALDRDNVEVVTEWRARALLKHYGHRFGYWLIEDHDWRLDLGGGRVLEFQLTPYLHFPGAFMSYDTESGTLFSSDIFGGFVPDAATLIAQDLDYALAAARPFHQHYMPSTALLSAGLARVQQRWPSIAQIAPQHGHIIPDHLVPGAFAGLREIQCGVFALSDADHDLQRLLRLAEAKAQLTESLLNIADPAALVASLDTVVHHTHHESHCALYIDVPDEGWTRWTRGGKTVVDAPPASAQSVIMLKGTPVAMLDMVTGDDAADVVAMIGEMAASIRPAIDQYVTRTTDAHRIATLRRASLTDPLTGLSNRRALDAADPGTGYALISLDLDHFKAVNDSFGHASGDVVLTTVAEVIRAQIRSVDSAYRVGGEEFLALLPATSPEAAVVIAERILAAIRARDLTGDAPGGRITASAGVAHCSDGGEPFASTLARADAALYASKDLGRDRVTLAQPSAAESRQPVTA